VREWFSRLSHSNPDSTRVSTNAESLHIAQHPIRAILDVNYYCCIVEFFNSSNALQPVIAAISCETISFNVPLRMPMSPRTHSVDFPGFQLLEPLPLTLHPAAVYLASLGEGSLRTMRESLDAIATLLTNGEGNHLTLIGLNCAINIPQRYAPHSYNVMPQQQPRKCYVPCDGC